MPIYLYRCRSCGGSMEKLQKAGDQPLVRCEGCGEDSLRKVIAPVGIVFKGSGFHKNDYGSKSSNGNTSKKTESGSGDATGSAKSKSSTEKSTESKKPADPKVA
ncbi:MAG: zinc ribbon domain-containing protein [Armatimonadetes bacterium]|nr:zinc ribbon domain-containing protein [Armatimonadota bacterium]